jgi:hypothetical protein
MLKGTNSNGCATAGISTWKFNAALGAITKLRSGNVFRLESRTDKKPTSAFVGRLSSCAEATRNSESYVRRFAERGSPRKVRQRIPILGEQFGSGNEVCPDGDMELTHLLKRKKASHT